VAEERPTVTYILIAAAALGVIAAVLVLASRPPRQAPSPPTLSADQQAYLPQIVVSDTRMSAAENFLGHTVIYLDGQVSNRGNRAVRGLGIRMEFVDMLNQVVLRERAHPLNPQAPPLKPGETRAFRVTFEHLPLEWNQAAPTIAVESVEF
jgi:hypothetical protein